MNKFIILLSLISSCGIKVTNRNEVGGEASITAKIEFSFPECARIQNEERLLKCIELATTVIVSLGNPLSDDQIEILEDLGLDNPSEEIEEDAKEEVTDGSMSELFIRVLYLAKKDKFRQLKEGFT